MTYSSEQLRLLRKFPGDWARYAIQVISEVHAGLPEDATLQQRQAAVDAAYPFGIRKYHPYKQWLKVRRYYLEPYGYISQSAARVGKLREEVRGAPLFAESPLERLYRRSGQGGAA